MRLLGNMRLITSFYSTVTVPVLLQQCFAYEKPLQLSKIRRNEHTFISNSRPSIVDRHYTTDIAQAHSTTKNL